MNYFKYLCVLLLSVGAASSAFAQIIHPGIDSCLTGVYSGKMQFEQSFLVNLFSSKSDFEMEVRSSSSDKMLILVTSETGEQFCTMLNEPLGGANANVTAAFRMRGVRVESRGKIKDVVGITDLPEGFPSGFRGSRDEPYSLFFHSSGCRKVTFRTSDSDTNDTADRVDKQPRSFDEIQRICNSLPAQ